MGHSIKRLVVAATLAASVPGVAAAHGGEIAVRIPARPGVVQPILYDAPAAAAKAVVILFPGGSGIIGIKGEGTAFTIRKKSNFLVRSRSLFVTAGLAAVAMDVPSDKRHGIGSGFRTSERQARDVAAVIAWLRHRVSAPIWLVGTSRGSISAASTALRDGQAVAGLVLTSSVDTPTRHHQFAGVSALPLGTLTMPVLVMDHVDESCPAVGDPHVLAGRMTASSRTALVEIAGGDPDKGGPCSSWSAHGYNGVEGKAVNAIVGFILKK